MSRMVAPILLRLAGSKHDILTIKLALSCPRWAESIRDMVFSDGYLMVVVDVGYSFENFDKLKHYMEHGDDPLAVFYPSGHPEVDGHDVSEFVANPLPPRILGFCASPVSKDLAEHTTVRLAAIELDHEDEARKIRAFERYSKRLILVDHDGGMYPMVYEGLISKPGPKECVLQAGQHFEIQFGGGSWNPDIPSWSAIVIEEGTVKKERMLSVFIRRGQYKKSDRYSEHKPYVIKATKLKGTELQDKVSKESGNIVRARMVDHDNTYKNIRAAYVTGPSCPSIREMLLGLRIDLLESVDLYWHIKDCVPDLQKHMTSLNTRQQDVFKAARHILGGILFYQGPPGTGKTYTLLRLIFPFLIASLKTVVLVGAPTNSGADDLARVLCVMLALDAAHCSDGKVRRGYVLRVYPERAEDEISRTQDPRPRTGSSKARKPSEKTVPATAQSKMPRIFEEFQAADKPKFDGVRDKRVSEVVFSLGYMRLLISGIDPDSQYAHPQAATKFAAFREFHKKQLEGKMLTRHEESIWKEQSEILTAIALHNARAIVSTTATLSSPHILKHVRDQVAAIAMDESAFQREDDVTPLFSTPFPLKPCILMAGDQQQLQPIVKEGKEIVNPFKPQLEISFMARMIALGMPYVMLTEQHRMVDQISTIANTLTYRGHLINDPCTKLCNRPLARQFRKFAEKQYGSLTNRLMIDLPPSKTNVVIRDEKNPNSKSKSNNFSVCIIAGLIKGLLDEFKSAASIAVLTPYKGQFFKLEQMSGNMRKMKLENFDKVTISTVDAALGRQFDIFVFDLTVGRSAGFLESRERLNVAVTRARDGLIVVGNKEAIKSAFYKMPMPTPYMKQMLPLFEGRTWTRAGDDEFPKTEFFTPPNPEPEEPSQKDGRGNGMKQYYL